MKQRKLGFFTVVLAFLIVIVTACSSSSKENHESFPDKPIQLVVAFSAGAATDTQARIISKYAKKYLGQEIAIVNKPGGGGQVGWNYFSTVNSDGYTLAAYNLPHIITQPLVGQTSFDVETFEPLVNWGWDPTVFAVKKDSVIQDLDDLVDKAKANPDTITVGNAGLWVGQHLAILLFEQSADVELKDVPFQGAADAIASLLGGHTDVVSGNLSDMFRLGDEVRILAIATEERHHFTPDVKTFKELGHPDVVMSTDRGIAAKKGTPPEVIDKLEKAFLSILEDDEFLKEMETAGADLLILNRGTLIEEFATRTKNYEQLLEAIGVK